MIMTKKWTIKKYLPILGFMTVFSLYLAGQITFDVLSTDTASSLQDEKKYVYYQNILSKLTLTTTDNQVIIPAHHPASVVILNFWASWCAPCLDELPSIVKMKKYFGDNILIVGINNDEKDQLKKIEEIKKKFNLNFPNVADKSGEIINDFLIKSIPSTLVFHEGKVFQFVSGSMDFGSELMETINSLIHKK